MRRPIMEASGRSRAHAIGLRHAVVNPRKFRSDNRLRRTFSNMRSHKGKNICIVTLQRLPDAPRSRVTTGLWIRGAAAAKCLTEEHIRRREA
jgi:hypothetical protein